MCLVAGQLLSALGWGLSSQDVLPFDIQEKLYEIQCCLNACPYGLGVQMPDERQIVAKQQYDSDG